MYQSVNNIYLSERQIGEQCGGTVEQWNSDGGTVWWNSVVEQSWYNSVVEQWNTHGETVCWNSRTVMVGQCGGTLEK